ncbi:MAG: TIGR00282 family metallophosphoesterase [Candidatus Saelkia tenebricola]|nr:TIGR00282 family metallophosphoesterase [Candidatus Saelkia tenebricola]
MKVLFIGDIVGRVGREIIGELLPKIRKREDINFVVANAENAAAGSGLTIKVVEELLSYRIDCITSGDHIWSKKDILGIIDTEPRLLRPANYPKGVSGVGSVVLKTEQGIAIGVLNLQGRVFMNPIECPFRVGLEEVEKLQEKTSIIIVDIHAEATSEKQALGHWLNGKVSAVLGTHTHVTTADEKILSDGTAFISDVGMTGPFYSVLGRTVDSVLKRFLTATPVRMDVATEDARIQAVLVEIDESTGKARDIKRVEYTHSSVS